jgi:hypothetical protein
VTDFPVPQYYEVMLLNNNKLANNFFNMTSIQVYAAIESNQLNLSYVASVLDKKTLALNIYYDELAYTTIEQVNFILTLKYY